MATELLGDMSGIASGFVDFGVIALVVVFALALLTGAFFLFKHFARYMGFKVVIWEVMDSGGLRVNYDKAGIFLMKKTGNKLLYLKRSNVGLNPDKISYVIDNKGKKVIYLLRYGFKNFVFINPVADYKGEINFKVGEEDVNWAVNSYEANKKRFTQSVWLQILPFMVLALVCVIILILMVNLFKNFSVFTNVADSIRMASENLKVCTIGTGAII